MCEQAKIVVDETQLEEAISDGVMHLNCPKCGCALVAEPDADSVWCEECDESIDIVNYWI